MGHVTALANCFELLQADIQYKPGTVNSQMKGMGTESKTIKASLGYSPDFQKGENYKEWEEETQSLVSLTSTPLDICR